MSTQEDRLAALEQRVADIELERLYEKNKARQNKPSEQTYDAQQVNHRLTMLLGIASGQEHAINSMQKDVSVIKEQISDIKQDIAEFYIRFDRVEKRFEAQDKKLDQVLQLLTTLATKADE